MKYLESASLASLSSQLTTTSPECCVQARVELYTTKKTNKDKKLYRSIEDHWEDEIAFKSASPDHPSTATMLESPFGPLDEPHALHTFSTLIATLNVAFPDHDFSDISPNSFTRDFSGGAPILGALSNTLTFSSSSSYYSSNNRQVSSRSFAAFPAAYSEPKEDHSSSSRSSSPITSILHQLHHTSPAAISSHPALFRTLNQAVTLSECEVYSYTPDVYSDPHAGDDSDSDSLASSDGDSLDNWEWDDYDDDGLPPNLTDSFHSTGSSSKKHSVDPWELSSSPDRDVVFSFEDDSSSGNRRPARSTDTPHRPPLPASSFTTPPTAMKTKKSYEYDSYEYDYDTYHRQQGRRRKGGLLWSSHWFFFHKKEKKVLFITIWARQREWMSTSTMTDSMSSGVMSNSFTKNDEAFGGWDGAVGAGMRAFENALEGRRGRV